MGSEGLIPIPTIVGFLVVFARVGGALVYLPLPGFSVGPGAARSAFSFLMAIAVYGAAPRPVQITDPWLLSGCLLTEAAFGITMGLLVNFTTEALLVGMQVVSIQAGYSYASTIDPTTQAESGVLIILAQLIAGLLFFAIGMDRQVLLAFARSLQTLPAGSFAVGQMTVDLVARAGAAMFANALLVASPIIALIVMADLALAVAGRLQTQLQVMGISFVVKMLLGLCLLAWTATLMPTVFERWSRSLIGQLGQLLR
jgi:flagellar biosynthetic protein FliR